MVNGRPPSQRPVCVYRTATMSLTRSPSFRARFDDAAGCVMDELGLPTGILQTRWCRCRANVSILFGDTRVDRHLCVLEQPPSSCAHATTVGEPTAMLYFQLLASACARSISMLGPAVQILKPSVVSVGLAWPPLRVRQDTLDGHGPPPAYIFRVPALHRRGNRQTELRARICSRRRPGDSNRLRVILIHSLLRSKYTRTAST